MSGTIARTSAKGRKAKKSFTLSQDEIPRTVREE